MALPLDVRDLMKSGSRFMEERSQPVRITVFVEVDAPDELIDAVRTQLRPATVMASLQIEIAELGSTPAIAPGADAVIGLAGAGNVGLREALAGARRFRVPTVVVAVGDSSRESELAASLQQPTADVVVKGDAADAVERMGLWLSDNVSSKKLAMAHNFAFMRRAVSEDAIRTTAMQNALIGVVTPIPGADMPLMTANQIKMLLQVAAAYGQPLNVERVKELAAVVAGGYLLRAVARQTLTVVPVLGWAIKGGIGYTGTVAMGRAAIRYFEEGADLGQVTAYFATMRDRAAAEMSRRRRRSLPPVEHTLPQATIAGSTERPTSATDIGQQSLAMEDDTAGA